MAASSEASGTVAPDLTNTAASKMPMPPGAAGTTSPTVHAIAKAENHWPKGRAEARANAIKQNQNPPNRDKMNPISQASGANGYLPCLAVIT